MVMTHVSKTSLNKSSHFNIYSVFFFQVPFKMLNVPNVDFACVQEELNSKELSCASSMAMLCICKIFVNATARLDKTSLVGNTFVFRIVFRWS